MLIPVGLHKHGFVLRIESLGLCFGEDLAVIGIEVLNACHVSPPYFHSSVRKGAAGRPTAL
jgi:hypothetical protein